MDKRNATIRAIAWIEQLSKPAIYGLIFGIFVVVAVVDFATGYQISCTVFYLLAIGVATWCVGTGFGIFVSVLSDACTSLANVVTGERLSIPFAPYWNAAIVLSFYLIVVWLLRSLREIRDNLDLRVRERTASLASELTERKRLEREVLAISEREQRRIGRDIHDSLCQHLTGTALAEQYLVEKLAARQATEVEDADRVVGLIEEAISMARGLVAGLSPFETEGVGLLSALADLASHFSSQSKVACRFVCNEPVLIRDATVSIHLYRIAQEAVHNAIRHGKARNITIRLARAGALVTLTISDDGSGLPADSVPSPGMGLRNMNYRASMIGGNLSLDRGKPGVIVTCSFQEGETAPA